VGLGGNFRFSFWFLLLFPCLSLLPLWPSYHSIQLCTSLSLVYCSHCYSLSLSGLVYITTCELAILCSWVLYWDERLLILHLGILLRYYKSWQNATNWMH